jgi:hypothetical protein
METQQQQNGGVTALPPNVKRTTMTINPQQLEKAEPEDRVTLSLLWQRCTFTLVDDPRDVGVHLYISRDDPARITYQLFVEIPGTYELHTERLDALRQFAQHTMYCDKKIEMVEKPDKLPRMWWRITLTVGSFRNSALPQTISYNEITYTVAENTQYNGAQGLQFKAQESDSHGLVKRVRLDDGTAASVQANGSRKRRIDVS